jgi:2-hydroxychromene-2-carboxylate isomerase
LLYSYTIYHSPNV